MAFLVLARMSSLWGGPDIVPPANGATTTQPETALPGFAQFMITRFSPLCWALPMNSSFNPKDAQAKQVLGEAAAMQKVIYSKTGPEYLQWLRNSEFPGMGMGTDLINEYLSSLEQLDVKAFRQFFQVRYTPSPLPTSVLTVLTGVSLIIGIYTTVKRMMLVISSSLSASFNIPFTAPLNSFAKKKSYLALS